MSYVFTHCNRRYDVCVTGADTEASGPGGRRKWKQVAQLVSERLRRNSTYQGQVSDAHGASGARDYPPRLQQVRRTGEEATEVLVRGWRS